MARTREIQQRVRLQLKSSGSKNVNRLLDCFMQELGCKNDAALSRALNVQPPVISKIRNGVLAPGAAFLIAGHEKTGVTFTEIRQILGVSPEYKF